MKVLSIDAWREPEGWTWNNWFTVGELKELPKENRDILRLLRVEGYLSNASKGKVAIDDDGYNVVIVLRGTGEPLIAVCYGEETEGE